MVVSPNKRRLYLAQEALEDAAREWDASAGLEPLVAALAAAIDEANAVANVYFLPDRDPGKARHVQGWSAELERLRGNLTVSVVAGVDLRDEILEAAAKATMFDNWHLAEERCSRGLGGSPQPPPPMKVPIPFGMPIVSPD